MQILTSPNVLKLDGNLSMFRFLSNIYLSFYLTLCADSAGTRLALRLVLIEANTEIPCRAIRNLPTLPYLRGLRYNSSAIRLSMDAKDGDGAPPSARLGLPVLSLGITCLSYGRQ